MKKIIFYPKSKIVINDVCHPIPSKKNVPEWYKKIPKYENNNFMINERSGSANTTLKSCMPFLDSLTSGYIQQTWCDIYIKRENDENIFFEFSTNVEILSGRDLESSFPKSINYYPNIKNFYNKELVWKQQWFPKTPKGYSMLYIHPLNRYDLPFLTFSGIVDNDVFYFDNLGNIPFYIKKDFEGIIPAGTPMYQMIPIKRDSWKSFFEKYNEELLTRFNLKGFFMDGYKKLYWQKKEYN